MTVNRLKLLCIEIYKTINNISPEFMRDLYSLRETSRLVLNLNICLIWIYQCITKLLLEAKALEFLDLKYGTVYFTI